MQSRKGQAWSIHFLTQRVALQPFYQPMDPATGVAVLPFYNMVEACPATWPHCLMQSSSLAICWLCRLDTVVLVPYGFESMPTDFLTDISIVYLSFKTGKRTIHEALKYTMATDLVPQNAAIKVGCSKTNEFQLAFLDVGER